ncbi:MAG: glycosyltransferase [Actinomycetia bacterium]|nr:glycosyltransferase [Actinomycetes bacterium]
MNIYVASLASALARAGVECDVLTRRQHPSEAPVVEIEPGFRVVHLDAGPPAPIAKHELIELVGPLADATERFMDDDGVDYDLLHANYWISGAVGHVLKHRLSLPLVATFHTLARVKADAGVDDDVEDRSVVEHETVNCCDLMLASTVEEAQQLAQHYGADPERIEIVPPGVNHDVFSPVDKRGRHAARRALGISARHVLLFAGRLQPLKGASLAIHALAELQDPDALLLLVGGPSGPDGDLEVRRLRQLVVELGLERQVRFVPPQPHDRLAVYYRAADICVVPSRTESFGLVALEAAACGTPVVAASVGGLRSIVEDGVTGYLVEGREPLDYATPLRALLQDDAFARQMGNAAELSSRRYAWSITAARLRRLYGDLAAREPVSCR